jgi:hypothetical protein
MLPKPEKSVRSKKVLPSESEQLELDPQSEAVSSGKPKKLVAYLLLGSFGLSTLFWLAAYLRSGPVIKFPSFSLNIPASAPLVKPFGNGQFENSFKEKLTSGQWQVSITSNDLNYLNGDLAILDASKIAYLHQQLKDKPSHDVKLDLPSAVSQSHFLSLDNSPYLHSVELTSPTRKINIDLAAVDLSPELFKSLSAEFIISVYWGLVGL